MENLILYIQHNDIIYLDSIDLGLDYRTKKYELLNGLILLFNYYMDFCKIFHGKVLIDVLNNPEINDN